MTDNFKRMVQELNEDNDIFVGHEYTLSNVKWACQVEKDNEKLQEYYKWLMKEIEEKGKENVYTIPTNMKQEKEVNLFVRAVTGTPLLEEFKMKPVKFMETIREMKNYGVTTREALEQKLKAANL